MTDDAPFGGNMLDTNVFNDVLDGRVDAKRLKGYPSHATCLTLRAQPGGLWQQIVNQYE
jgi:hypothetical protein